MSAVFAEKTTDISLWFPRKMTSEKRAQKFHNDDAYKPDLGRVSDWLEICFIQSEALPRSGYWRVIGLEFLRSFRGESTGSVARYRLFSKAVINGSEAKSEGNYGNALVLATPIQSGLWIRFFIFTGVIRALTTPIQWPEKSSHSLKSLNDNLDQSKYSIQINHLLKEMEAEFFNYLRC